MPPERMKNIVLVGFMGTGKTSVSREIAKRLGMRYVSTDALVEAREGMSIAEIFASKGEPYFRDAESAVAVKVSRAEGSVIDAGGGIVIRDENVRALKSAGILVCLTARPDAVIARTKGSKKRPLLNVPDPLRAVEELLRSRQPYYAKADITVDTSDLTVSGVAETVIEKTGAGRR